MMMRRTLFNILLLMSAATVHAQVRVVQNKPYIDLRPLHFGIQIGLHMQDIELKNVGLQQLQLADGSTQPSHIVCDADQWNPGFSVGVMAEWRLGAHLAARVSPTMHFGAKHLTYLNMLDLNEHGHPTLTTQDMKNTYISLPLDIKFSAERFNNYRPYMVAGVSPMVNLSGTSQDILQLKRYDFMVEAGIGCDFYMRFFKLVPELKFCYGLTDALDHGHASQLTDVNKRAYANAVSTARTKMVMLTLYFE